MKKFFVGILISVLCLLGLSACSSEQTIEKKTVGTEKQVEKQDQKQETKKEEKSEYGARSNPVLKGTTATISSEHYDDKMVAYKTKTDFTVTEVIRGDAAAKIVKEGNMFNELAPEGYEFIITKIKARFVESENKDLPLTVSSFDFDYISSSGDIYSGNVSVVIDNELDFEGYIGNEKEGYIVGLTKTGESAQLRYSDKFFFNLE